MDTSDKDLFNYRSSGGHFNIGSEEGDNVSALVKFDDQLMCITRKNIRTILMADTIDPQRTNPEIDHNIQNILPYGSDNEFVGRTFQQASILFKENSLSERINHEKGISISFSFLKEITALEKTRNEYHSEENLITSNLSSNNHLPSLPNLEQKIKSFISNADHASALIMEMSNLFYTDVKGKGWESKLIDKLNSPEQDSFIDFVKKFKDFTEKLRTIRNKIEHPHGDLKGDVFIISNYKLTPLNTLDLPSIIYTGKEHNLPKTNISSFMNVTVSNLLTIFELLMVYLCNLHAKPFADDKRVVVEIPDDKREESAKHVGFTYQILWTK